MLTITSARLSTVSVWSGFALYGYIIVVERGVECVRRDTSGGGGVLARTRNSGTYSLGRSRLRVVPLPTTAEAFQYIARTHATHLVKNNVA